VSAARALTRASWWTSLGLAAPVVQAGMGGGLSTATLAAAVSNAGGLGTIGLLPAAALADELRRARQLAPGRPVAANLLVPFLRRAHVEVCVRERPALVALFGGFDRAATQALRAAGIVVLHQVGTLGQATRALDDGADLLVVQGIDAGGHVIAETTRDEALRAVRGRLASVPLLAAGGIHDAASAAAAIEAGADGVVAGTRYLLTPECDAHPGYKARALGAATARWCNEDGDTPAWIRAVHRLTSRVAAALPDVAGTIAAHQRVGVPLYSPVAPLAGMPDASLETSALYAGRCAAAISSLRPAAAVTRGLADGCARARR
jgi:NAD(P)H-dependent flavin oxidoreductase YrpB (nitropropane dioxygenase family)